MKFSIITTVHNDERTITDTLESVASQTYPEIEHIVVDNNSCDNTGNIVNRYMHGIASYIKEPDKGIYFGINKGLNAATGDIIGILSGDDIYADENVISDVVKAFEQSRADCVYGDLVYVKRCDTNSILRYWRAGQGDRAKIYQGWMPPHPSFFVRQSVYKKYGYFNTDFKISADYEIILLIGGHNT